MGFWIFMLAVNLLIPAIMIGFGFYYAKHAPREINPISGYRTNMSMKNQDTWVFAHNHFGRIWRATGLVMLPITVLAMLPLLKKDIDTVGDYGLLICFLEIIPLAAPIFFTERALRRNFDDNGIRKK